MYFTKGKQRAFELLMQQKPGFDRYCAEGLLAKVYLTKSGLSGTRNADDLAKERT